jgi:hypothetical protein
MFLSKRPIGGRLLEVHRETRVSQTSKTTANGLIYQQHPDESVGWAKKATIDENQSEQGRLGRRWEGGGVGVGQGDDSAFG